MFVVKKKKKGMIESHVLFITLVLLVFISTYGSLL